jgi:hypothetical protein
MANKNERRFTGGGRKTQGDRSRPETDAASQPGKDASAIEGVMNKTELVHAAIGNHPRASAERITRILGDQGVRVSPAMVSSIKERMRGGGRTAGEEGRPKGERGKGGITRRKPRNS